MRDQPTQFEQLSLLSGIACGIRIAAREIERDVDFGDGIKERHVSDLYESFGKFATRWEKLKRGGYVPK